MTRVTGRRAAESAAVAESELWPDESVASKKNNAAVFRKRMAPPLSWGPLVLDRTQREVVLALARPLQGFRHLSGGLWSRGCKPRVLRWLGLSVGAFQTEV